MPDYDDILKKYDSLTALINKAAESGNAEILEIKRVCGSFGEALHAYFISCIDELNALRAENLELEEKNKQLEEKLTELEKAVPKNDYNYCLQLAKKNYSKYWNIMEKDSKVFIVTALYLFGFLKAKNADFGPVVLELTKSLEEELSQKIYLPFVKEQSEKTILDRKSKLQSCVLNYKYKPYFYFEFTMMFKELNPPPTSSFEGYWTLLHQSLGKQGWHMFTITSKNFTNAGVDLALKYRNRAAHAEVITKEEVNECSKKTKELTYTLLSAYPNKK